MQLIIWVILTIVGAFMAVLDTTIVDIIVPRLKGPLSTDMYGVQWVITAYMISAAVGLLVVVWLIKNFGNKNIYITGVAIFTIASFLCGVSDTLNFMIFSRSLQGFGEALIMVTSHAMIFSYFPPHKKGIAMGIFALGVAFAPAIGPTLGGYLTEWFSWRAVFFINVPIGIVLVVFGLLLLPDLDKKERSYLNIISLLSISVFTISLLIMLSKGQQFGWFGSDFIIKLAFISWFGFLAFIFSEISSKKPLFNYILFKNYHFTLGIAIYFILLGFSMYQYFYLIPIFYEQLKGLGSIEAGLGVLGFGIWIGIFSILAGILSDKFSPVYVLVVGAVLYIYSAFFLFPTINYYTSFYEAVLKTMPFGIAMGLFFAPITVMVMNSAKNDVEQSIVIMDYVRFIGGSFGTVIATNNLVFFKNKEFEAMSNFQDYSSVSEILEKVNYLVFRNLEEFMSFNYGFKSVWLDAGYWGLFGSLLVFLLLFKKFKNPN